MNLCKRSQGIDCNNCCVPPEVLLDPCRTWCPSSNCQAVCQLKESDSPALPQLVQCAVCALEFCSACKANWHPGQACQESNLPITSFLPGENRYGPECMSSTVDCPQTEFGLRLVGCEDVLSLSSSPRSSFYKNEEDDAPIKRCPKCKVYIERDEGCAQMMCKNCKHAFCWYCLESLDVSWQPPFFGLISHFQRKVSRFAKSVEYAS